MSIKKPCYFCESDNTKIIQDARNKTTTDGAQCGVLLCNNCNQVMFWYFKTKEKFKISFDGSEVEYSCIPKFVIVPQWDGPITPFIWNYIKESSKITGRLIESYYVTYSNLNDQILEHRLIFKD